jgi:hypothetical protein
MSPIEKIKSKKKKITGTLVIVIMLCSLLFVSTNLELISIVRGESTTQFSYYKRITIDHNQVTATLTNFPVCINLSSDADLASDALDNGWDIAFFDGTDAGANQYNHEIELFNGTTGQLVTWVNVTSLSDSSDTNIYMFYGDSDISISAENPTGVWNSNFVFVHHLEETDIDGGVGDITDSTSYDNDGTTHNLTVSDSIATIFGYGMNFSDEEYKYISFGNPDEMIFSSSDSVTLEGWAYNKPPSPKEDNYKPLIAKGYYVSSNNNKFIDLETQYGSEGYARFHVRHDSVYVMVSEGAETVNEVNEWHYFVGVYDDGDMYLYVDGKLIDSDVSADLQSTVNPWRIGKYTNYFTNDTIDEVRVSNGARNLDWIATTYNMGNNATDGGFFTLGSEEGGESESVYSLNGLTSQRVTFEGVAGNIVWCNSTGDGNEWIEVNMSVNATHNVTYLTVHVEDLNASVETIGASNLSLYVSSDNVSYGYIGTFSDGGGNCTYDVNSTNWNAGTMGANPFTGAGITDKTDSIYFIFRLTLDADLPGDVFYSPAIDSCIFYIGYYG